MTDLKQVSRWKKIYITAGDDRYFNHKGTRYYLSMFMKLRSDSYPEWHGHLTLTNTCAMLIKLSSCGEAVQTALIY